MKNLKLYLALEKFKKKYPDTTSGDWQTFILGYNAAAEPLLNLDELIETAITVSTEVVNLPDGIYNGIYGGYVIDVVDEQNIHILKEVHVEAGVKGFNLKCKLAVKDKFLYVLKFDK